MSVKMVLHLKKEQENAEWLKRANVNMMVDNKKVFIPLVSSFQKNYQKLGRSITV
jgi:hypothetical protein